jgi:2-polyprenyl-6-hydroxyphenyl methylase/3-demethylubiquinone-9 3-methyltransferase
VVGHPVAAVAPGRDVAPVVLAAARVRPGDQVLDVVAGPGNDSMPAAEAGALAIAAAEAEALPFPDGSFDVVLSTFGVMLAPRHDAAAGELARVLRSGGRLALANWTPDGFGGRIFRMLGGFLPPAPDFASPPAEWGSETHVGALFAAHGVTFTFDRAATTIASPSPDAMVADYFEHFGPLLAAHAIVEPEGRGDELQRAFRELIVEANDGSGAVEIAAEYLLALGRKA